MKRWKWTTVEAGPPFPLALVSPQDRVYFDVSSMSDANRRLVEKGAGDSPLVKKMLGRTFYAAELIKPYVPEDYHDRLDEMVEKRRSAAREKRGRGGLLRRKRRE